MPREGEVSPASSGPETAVRSERRGALQVAAAALLWSTGGLAIKYVPAGPLEIEFHRAWIAGIALLLLLRPRKTRITWTLAAAVVACAATVIAFVVATKWTTSANAIFLQDSGIVWVLIFSPLIARDPISRRDVIAVVVCLGGMALFFLGKISVQAQAGNIVGFASGLTYAALILLLRRQGGAAAQWTVILGNVLAAALLIPFLHAPLAFSARSWGVLVFLGVVQIGCAYALFVRGIGHIPATEASVLALLEPVFNPVWVYLGIGERPSGFAIAGALAVLAAIIWRTFSAGPEPDPRRS